MNFSLRTLFLIYKVIFIEKVPYKKVNIFLLCISAVCGLKGCDQDVQPGRTAVLSFSVGKNLVIPGCQLFVSWCH